MTAGQYYKPSGRFSPIGLVVALAMGIVGAAISAAIYAYIMAWLPLVYFNILFIIGYAVLLGMVTATGISVGKIRNSVLGGLLGLVVGATGLYTAWVFWIYAQSSQEVFIWLPTELIAAISYLGEEGVWSIKGATPTGWVLYGFWLVEAGALVLAPLLAGFTAVSSTAFCEKCDGWMEDEVAIATFNSPSDIQSIQRDLEAGRLDKLKTLYAVPPGEPHHTVVLQESCPKCSARLLSLKSRVITLNDEGEEQVQDDALVSRLRVDDLTLENIEAHWTASFAEEQEKLNAPSEPI